MSRLEARRLLARGAVWIDGVRCKIASKLVRDPMKIEVVQEESGRAAPERVPLPILLQDDDVLAVDKPAGVASQATPSGDFGTLPDLVAQHLGVPIGRVQTVHRLDRETSGVVVFGRHPRATTRLAAAFREGTAHKLYFAAVAGALVGEGRLEAKLAESRSRRGSWEVREDGVPAITAWQSVASPDGAWSFVMLRPETGRTHQLRVHLAHLGHPILGDVRYGGPRTLGTMEFPRLLLHARRLTVPHPRTGEPLTLEAPIPADLLRFAGERPHPT